MALLTVEKASNSSLGGSSYTPQKTVNPQPKTHNPQKTVSSSINQLPIYTVPTAVSGGSGSGGGGATRENTVNTGNVVDPFSQWGGKAAYDSLVSGYENQKNTIFDSSNLAAKTSAGDIKNSILDLVDSLITGQNTLDNRSINNELAKTRGTADVYAGVGRGIRSGGTMLTNNNAADSSAAEGIARAYGDIGRRQLSEIGNQYALEKTDIGLAQSDLERQAATGMRHITSDKDKAYNTIVSDAQNQLAALDTAMANASLPERIQLDAEKQRIRSQVLATLSQYDSMLTKQVGGVKPMSRDEVLSTANKRNTAGQSPDAVFDYTTTTPAQFQNTGPYASSLPIFTYNNKNKE